jgi:hypothetical protein
MGSILPLRIALVSEFHVSLMHERGCLQSVTGPLMPKARLSNSPQFVVDKGNQPGSDLLIAVGQLVE